MIEYKHCGTAEGRTNGVYFCTRKAGHEGPCATVLSDIVQGGTDFGKTRLGWNRAYYSQTELIAIGKFAEEHKKSGCTCDLLVVADSAQSGIGTNTVIRCSVCNMHENVTDYESW